METHWIARKRVLWYLKGTISAALHYRSKIDIPGLIGYSDSDYAEDITRRSTSGRLFVLAGGAIAWASRKQSLVASSTSSFFYYGSWVYRIQRCSKGGSVVKAVVPRRQIWGSTSRKWVCVALWRRPNLLKNSKRPWEPRPYEGHWRSISPCERPHC